MVNHYFKARTCITQSKGCLSESWIYPGSKTDIYQNSFDYRPQCQNAYSLLRIVGWSKCKCTKLFGVDHKAFVKQLNLPLENNEIGRPSSLNDEEQQLLFQKIQSLLVMNKHPTLFDIEYNSFFFVNYRIIIINPVII